MPIERIRASDMKRMKEERDAAVLKNKQLVLRDNRVLEELRSKLWAGAHKTCRGCGVHFSERHHADCVLNNAIEILEDEL
jgi:hypothetical protein